MASDSTDSTGKGFLLPLTLRGTQSYESAYMGDILRLGVGTTDLSDVALGRGFFWTKAGIFERKYEDLPAPSPAPPAAAQTTPTIVAGGHFEAVHSPSHTPPPITALSSSVPPPQYPDRPRAMALVDGQRRVIVRPVSEVDALAKAHNLQRFVIGFHVATPESFDGHERGLLAWVKNMVWALVSRSDGTRKIFHLCIDTAGGVDSWTFCSMPYSALSLFGGHLATEEESKVYGGKQSIPAPPQTILDNPDHRADIKYGVADRLSSIRVCQTLVKLAAYTDADDESMVNVEDFPLGVLVGLGEGSLISSIVDGILTLPCERTIKLFYPEGVKWPSEGFVAALCSRGLIDRRTFWIRIAHPTYDQREFIPNYACFGALKQPDEHARIGKRVTIGLPKRDAFNYPGKWVVWLDEIIFQPADKKLKSTPIIIDRPVIIDTGCTQTYFDRAVATEFTDLTASLGAPSADICPTLNEKDLLIFVFGGTKVYGEARRFLGSPLRYAPGDTSIPMAVRPSTGKTCVLGVNFFRTFLVGFDDYQSPAIYLYERGNTI